MPAFFKKTTRNDTPVNSIIISCLLGTALMYMSFSEGMVSAFEFLITISVVLTLLPYLFSSGAALKNTLANHEISATSKAIRIVPPVLAMMFALWILANLSLTELIWAGGLLILGFPFFIYQKANRK
jgi:amino acid transporter